MPTIASPFRVGRLLLGLVLGVSCACATAGCGSGGDDKPAGFSPEVQKKNQDMMSGGYREAYRADYVAKGKLKDTAAKKGP
jgi:hypothetical protein